MAEIVNLRQWRKRQRRIEAEDKAAQNRASFGQTKAGKARRNLSQTQSVRHLDQHLLTPEPEDSA